MKFNKDIVISLILLVFCLLNYFYLIPTQVIKQGSSPNYPYIVITFLLFFSIVYLVISIKKYKILTKVYTKISFFNDSSILKVISIISLVIFYVYLIESLGFILVSVFLIIAVMLIYGLRDYIKIIIIATIFPIIVSWVFRILLHSILPGGIIEQILFGW